MIYFTIVYLYYFRNMIIFAPKLSDKSTECIINLPAKVQKNI